MTAYNGERFINQAINSLVNQNYTDWSMLISDDESKDKTGDICKEWAKKDNRITYHRQKKNIGMFPNFKFVLDSAQGEYFMWAAQDDIWEKDFLKVCVEHLEKNKNLGFAMTTVADADSFGRTLREMPDMRIFCGKPRFMKIARYVLQPEVLGRCNMMYSLFRTDCIKKIWSIYPQRHEWGSDYLFVLAGISRFENIVDKKVLFKKRYGGFSSPKSSQYDRIDVIKKVEYKNPKNHMFPLSIFRNYFRGHMEALKGTSYLPLTAILLVMRLPRAFFIRLKQKFS